MAKAAVLMADGVEETEGLAVVDLLRRARIDTDMISAQNRGHVVSSHGIDFRTDVDLKETDFRSYDALILPGGMKGTEALINNITVLNEVQTFAEKGKLVAAICAGPTVLGKAGVLRDRHAICYPGLEDRLLGAIVTKAPAVRDGNIITSRGMGTAIDFGLAIIEYLLGTEKAHAIAEQIVYGHFTALAD